jgi:hypothetical protein
MFVKRRPSYRVDDNSSLVVVVTIAFDEVIHKEWKRLTEAAMEIVRTRDSGTLQYESS